MSSIDSNPKLYVITRGGFGNVLFNYLIGTSLSKKNNMDVIFIDSNDGNRLPMSKYRIFDKLNIITNIPNCSKISERMWQYYHINIPNNNMDYLLDGYFQSYKHSIEYIKEIKNNIYSKLNKPEIELLYNQYKNQNKKTIMLHVRRGDYLAKPDYHPVLSDNYYKKSLDKLIDNIVEYKIIVFSDDIPYIKQWKLLDKYNYDIIDILDIEDTFLLMTMCDNFIIANSSFSLLAYYFRRNLNAVLCMPNIWFGPRGPRYNLSDLVEMTDKVNIINN
jgi:hypothetical protein